MIKQYYQDMQKVKKRFLQSPRDHTKDFFASVFNERVYLQ